MFLVVHFKMSVILGIHVGHNASVALMINGNIKLALQEERFQNIKNFQGFPEKSLRYIKQYLSTKNLIINEAAFSSTDCPIFELKYPLNHFFSIKDFHEYYGEKYYSKKLKNKNVGKYISDIKKDVRFKSTKNIFSEVTRDKDLFNNYAKCRAIVENNLKKIFNGKIKKISFLDHHTCHAYYGKYSIDVKEKKFAVVVLDSMGDGINQSIWINDPNKNQLKNILRNSQCQLARIYKFVTLLLNMKPDEHEFKVMGMAPYARKKYYMQIYKDVFKNILKFKGLAIIHKNRPKDLYQYLKTKLKYHRFDNISGATQYYLEKIVLELLHRIYKKYKINTFFFSGGVSMNIKMYNIFLKDKKIKKIYNAPSGSDESIPIGACYYLNRKMISYPLENLSLGMHMIKDNQSLKNIIKENFKRNYKIKFNTHPRVIAKLLNNNKIIALVNGREEFGARALGNRSIIANPSFYENIKKINSLIKSRDFWLPFALTIRNENINDFVKNPKNLRSDFMNLSFDTKEKNFKKILAGCHPYDRSVRPQFLRKTQNGKYYSIITEFGKLSKTYALLNTSLNLQGKPKSSDFKSIFHTFKNSGLKYLYIDNKILITKT